jgi:hypothetical protein
MATALGWDNVYPGTGVQEAHSAANISYRPAGPVKQRKGPSRLSRFLQQH